MSFNVSNALKRNSSSSASSLARSTSKNLSKLFVLKSPNSSASIPTGITTTRDFSAKDLTSKISSSSHTSEESNVLRPLVVCGPSGVGKGTIISKFMKELNGSQNFGFTVSHTTRSPRPGEEDGVHYHFTDVPSMKQAIDNNDFLEYAEVHGNFYGTSIKSLTLDNGKFPLLDIDVQGVKKIKQRQLLQRQSDNDDNEENVPILDAKFIFIAPPSLEILLKRLKHRGTETEESIKRRTENAVAEMQYGLEDGNFDAIVVNDDLHQACDDFRNTLYDIYGL
jgi:guanylate kinase